MKDQIINIRVDKETKEQIKHRAESLDLNVSEYLLHCHHFNDASNESLDHILDTIKVYPSNPESKTFCDEMKERVDFGELAEVRSIIDSDMEDSVKVSVLKKIV